jgi:uncharacterized membrane protein
MAAKDGGVGQKLASGVTSGLANSAKGLVSMAGKRLMSSATDKMGATTQRLTEYVSGDGGSGLMDAVTGKGGDSKGGSGKKGLKVTNIVEQVDIAAPIRLVYDQWTSFSEFPTFMKKVESVEQEEDAKLKWRAQILWSHREWESTITEQVPDRRIIWTSEGQKGKVDGTVTFHELAPELTRVIVNLQYYPQGFFEHTGNIWRAQGRRARLELKHFARHVMNEAILHPDEVPGWRGEIHDGEVVKDDEQARQEEQAREQEQSGREESGREQGGPEEERRESGRPDQGRESGRREAARAPRRGAEERPAGRPEREPGRRPAREQQSTRQGRPQR